ncbi:MAG: hemerythrin domain-containing protein [Thiomargarita sp.]|nr:hemerythrin domain-containing protein [Thiomargarita sp.]
MTTITQTFSRDHARCDQLFAQAEESVAKSQWERATTDVNTFITGMERHFSIEEDILFPAFRKRTGHNGGPTRMMQMEHQQMRQVFAEMQEYLTQQDREQYLGLSETLLMLMRQHNAKEEQMLYPMTDKMLQEDTAPIIEKMAGDQ